MHEIVNFTALIFYVYEIGLYGYNYNYMAIWLIYKLMFYKLYTAKNPKAQKSV